MTEVNKSELAKYLDVRPSMVSKHVKAGTLDKCFTPNGKKLFLEKAVQAIALSQKRDPKKTIEMTIPNEIKNNSDILNDESKDELEKLVNDAQSSSQKVQVIKDFWLGKINRQKFMEAEGELLTLKSAKAAVEAVFTPINAKLDELPLSLKSRFTKTELDAVKWLANEIDNIKKESLAYWSEQDD